MHACLRACVCARVLVCLGWYSSARPLGVCTVCTVTRYLSRHMRAGVYEYTKASSAAISKIADAIAPLTSLTGAIMEVNNRLALQSLI